MLTPLNISEIHIPMSKPYAKKRSIAAISFATPERLRKAIARSEKLHGPRGLSRYIRQLVDSDAVTTK